MEKEKLTHRSRMENVLSGGPVDRIPVSLWRHFPVDDQTPEKLAAAILSFQRTYDFDFVKVTPASSFCVKDWGAQDEWRGATEGTRDYFNFPVKTPEDWRKLVPLDPGKGFLGEQLKCLRLIMDELGSQTPVIQTIFNPLSQAKNLVSRDKLVLNLRLFPQALHEGLKIITESTARFIEEALKTGISGIFFAVQHAQYRVLAESEYQEFGRAYDLQLLEMVKSAWLNVLHLHGEEVMFDMFVDYPVQVINWHDRDTRPTLSEGQQRYKGVVCGGLQRERTIVLGTPEEVKAEARDAIQSVGGKRFILGTGCVVPINAPHGNILAARHLVME